MSPERPADERQPDPDVALDAGFRLVVVLVGLAIVLGALVLVRGGSAGAPGGGAPGPEWPQRAAGELIASPSIDPATFLYPDVRDAPPISLEDAGGPRGDPRLHAGGFVLVFFGYTHCPDVCPATIGTVGAAMRAYGPGVRAVFVTIDPQRDTPAWLTEYALPGGGLHDADRNRRRDPSDRRRVGRPLCAGRHQ